MNFIIALWLLLTAELYSGCQKWQKEMTRDAVMCHIKRQHRTHSDRYGPQCIHFLCALNNAHWLYTSQQMQIILTCTQQMCEKHVNSECRADILVVTWGRQRVKGGEEVVSLNTFNPTKVLNLVWSTFPATGLLPRSCSRFKIQPGVALIINLKGSNWKKLIMTKIMMNRHRRVNDVQNTSYWLFEFKKILSYAVVLIVN